MSWLNELQRKQSNASCNPHHEKDIYKRKEELYICCINYDFSFSGREIDYVVTAWTNGVDVPSIASNLKRAQAEVVFLIIDLAEADVLSPREGGLL